MWLQLRLYLLISLVFTILFGILAGLAYLLQYVGYIQLSNMGFFYLLFILAFLMVFIQYLIGPKIVEWTMKVKYIKPNEYPKLHRMVETLAQDANLPKTPKIGISEVKLPNAFAFGRTKRDSRVCVTRQLMDILSDEELKSVLGHEIAHIQHRDVAVITMLSVVPMICYMLYIMFFWGGLFSRRQRDSGSMIAIGLLALAIYFITSLFVMYASRIREYYADLGSVQLGNQPHHLATALYKLSISSAKTPKNILKQAEGMKAFFLNDPSNALAEVRAIKDIDIDMSGTIDQNELRILSEKKVKISTGSKVMEVMSTHPNMVKRIKQLSELQETY